MLYKAGIKIDRYLMLGCTAIVLCLIALGIISGIKSIFSEKEPVAVSTFIASYVKVETEEFWGNGIRHIRIKNNSNTEAYVRCTPIFTVRDKSGNVCDAILVEEETLNINYRDWVKIGSYYYCKKAVGGGKYTPFVIEGCKQYTEDGNRIELKLLVSAIDSSDSATVLHQWGIAVNSDGTIGGN